MSSLLLIITSVITRLLLIITSAITSLLPIITKSLLPNVQGNIESSVIEMLIKVFQSPLLNFDEWFLTFILDLSNPKMKISKQKIGSLSQVCVF